MKLTSEEISFLTIVLKESISNTIKAKSGSDYKHKAVWEEQFKLEENLLKKIKAENAEGSIK
jgi:hypothetical protein